ncbi:MAG: iron chelate uptake ABC transporter family permease subunit [Flavobacteriales bacterium]|nr:iron chelate uptake ABC transporter family permease subunit [Flavobacteriales bacterium]
MRPTLAYSSALLVVLSLFLVHLAYGPVGVPFGAVVNALLDGANGDPAWVAIVREVRLPEALAALLVGAGLATCGVLMQTLFANPLAGPSVLGVTSGASLGVAVLMLGSAWFPIAGAALHGMVILAAFAGSLLVLLLVLLADRRVGDGITLLILGLMVGYFCSALIRCVGTRRWRDRLARVRPLGNGKLRPGRDGRTAVVGGPDRGRLVVVRSAGQTIERAVAGRAVCEQPRGGSGLVSAEGDPDHRSPRRRMHGVLWTDRFHRPRYSPCGACADAQCRSSACAAGQHAPWSWTFPGVRSRCTHQRARHEPSVERGNGFPGRAGCDLGHPQRTPMGANERMMDLAVRTEGLVVGHGRRALTTPLDLRIMRGQLVALLGNNGIGKSTLLSTLAGSIAPLAGGVAIEGLGLHSMSAKQRSRAVAIVLSFRPRTGLIRASEVVAMGRMPWTDALGRMSQEDERIVQEAVQATGMEALRDRAFDELSDGEAQKVMVARALAQRTPVLLLDEPTAFLDIKHRTLVMRLLRTIAHDRGVAVIFSTHDLAQALEASDLVLLMQGDGQVWQGSPDEAVTSGAIERAFQVDGSRFDREALRFRTNS